MSKNIDKMKFFIGEPDETGKEVSHYEYNKAGGLIDRFKAAGITIRYTHSLEEMKRQHETLWHEYLEQFLKRSEKNGNHVDEAYIKLAKKNFLKNEVDLFTGFLARNQARDNIEEIESHLKYLKMEIERLADGKQKAGTLSFSWTGNQAQLEAFCQALKDAGYIDPDTTNEAFIAIFSGRETDSNLHRVTWIKRTGKSKSIAKNAVTTMFDLLVENGKIPDNETKNKAEFFRKLEACFCDEAGNPLKFEHKHLSYSKDHGNQLRQIITSL